MSKYSVKKPISVLMMSLIIIVLGFFSVSKMKPSLFPDMELPYMVVVTTYTGATPEEVETEVTSKIETAVASLTNFKEVTSTSNEHYSMITITFNDGANLDTAQVELRESLSIIDFAEGVSIPTIMKITPDLMPVMQVSIARDYEGLDDEQELIQTTNWVENEVIDKLKSVNGVASITTSGGAETVLQIQFDETKMYGLNSDQVLDIIEKQNISNLVGVALDNGEIRLVYLGNKINVLSELKNLPITSYGGEVVRLEDMVVADGVKFLNQNRGSYFKINGKQCVSLSIQKSTNVAVTEATENIKKALNRIEKEYDGASYIVFFDQGDYIEVAIDSVLENLLSGALLAILILFIFLRNYRPTLIVAVSIPLSVIAAFAMMYFLGVGLNMLSMGGLALAVGMLVDNSIVVIENIYRMRQEGKSSKEAAIYGAKEVAGAITSSTLTTICVFLPIAFVSGLIADVMLDMIYTVAFSLLASLFIALTIIPCMSSRILKGENFGTDGRLTTKIKSWYEKGVSFCLKYKVLTIITAVLLLVGSIVASFSKGFILLDSMDEGTITATVVLAEDVTFEELTEYADYLYEDINSVAPKAIETVSVTYNQSSSSLTLSESAGQKIIDISISLSDGNRKSSEYYAKKINTKLKNYDYSRVSIDETDVIGFESVADASSITALTANGVNIRVKGEDLETMEKIANKVASIVSSVEGIETVDNGVNTDLYNVKINVNRDDAILAGLTQTDVNNSLNLFYTNPLLGAVASGQTKTIVIEGIEYEISIPTSSSVNQMFGLFGTYQDFLSGVQVFDTNTRNLLLTYTSTSIDDAIYTPLFTGGKIVLSLNDDLYRVESSDTIEIKYYEDGEGAPVGAVKITDLAKGKLTEFAEVTTVTGYSTINSDGKYRYFDVKASLKDGYNITKVSSEVNKKVNAYLDSEEFKAYGSNFKVEFKGENEEVMSAVKDLFVALLVGILIVYMIMAIQFQSIKYPLIILAAIPLAFTGGLLALWICGFTMSVVAIMGLITLVGVAVNNGIVLIDYINILRESGKGIKESIIEAGKTRLRPILMTALTTILGLLTIAFGFGTGSELLQPMAIVVVGGLFYSTILTLIVIPVIYGMFNHKKLKEEMK
ncbi:MAG: efflux RND transporter permease subunit [Erysipelotrichaceae bacterium]|nr:efflux RND transporter permease subunit [Erysipelotrichaceae bacterium]